MNSKLCKRLRRSAYFSIEAKEFPTTYIRNVAKTIKHEAPALHSDGTIDETKPSTFFTEERITMTLNPSCKRALYKELKGKHA